MPQNGFHRFAKGSRRRTRLSRTRPISPKVLARIKTESNRERNRIEAMAIPEIRRELVARVRAAIHAGTYDTTEKFDLALERLIFQNDLD